MLHYPLQTLPISGERPMRALVFLALLVSGPWLVRTLALRMRNIDMLRGGVRHQHLIALVMGVLGLVVAFLLVGGLWSGSVDCFARNCSGQVYNHVGDAVRYWITIGSKFVTSVSTCTLAAVGFSQWRDQG